MVYPAESFNPQATLEAVEAERCTSLCEYYILAFCPFLLLGKRATGSGWAGMARVAAGPQAWGAARHGCRACMRCRCAQHATPLRHGPVCCCQLPADGVPTMFIAEFALPK